MPYSEHPPRAGYGPIYSSCNPLQTNPYGGQFFAMHFDGSGLRQLSAFKGMVTEADADGTVKTVTVEAAGPIAIVPPGE